MATVQHNGALMHGEFEPEGGAAGCGCFQSFWSTRKNRSTVYDDELNLLQEGREQKELWVVIQLKKLKETSELVAGPKWKNFVRKIGGYFTNKKRNDFRYDSYNYTLNFDDGMHEDDEDHGGLGLGFSSRFAPPAHDEPRSSI